jgi:polysaccharide export outer membrane protein
MHCASQGHDLDGARLAPANPRAALVSGRQANLSMRRAGGGSGPGAPMKRRSAALLLPILVTALAAFILGSEATADPRPGDTEPDSAMSGDYRIGVGDLLNIQVWKEADLTRSVPVRPDGKISFPLLDDIQAAGLSPLELKVVLTGKLKQFLSEPRVTVLVEEVNSYKVYVMGEVLTQGALTLKSKTTLLQAISLAGGFTQYAKRNEITVLRRTVKRDERIIVSYDRILSGKNPEQNLTLEPGDTVVVP